MVSRATAEEWLRELTNLPTASGLEHHVMAWVEAWVGRRHDLKLSRDGGGNLLVTQKGRKTKSPVLAIAHMDHPAFVVTGVEGTEARFEFRGGVRPEYFQNAQVVFVTGEARSGRVTSYDPGTQTGLIRVSGSVPAPNDIARWRFSKREPRTGLLLAPACDDLAGCAAALAALDRARARPHLRHFGVLLTRAEEVGFVGAIHAVKSGTVPADARLLSIETSRASTEAPIGGGPVIRVGDAATVFDHELTNLVSQAMATTDIPHQRKLMAGGSCEATAFGVYGYRATGICLPLGGYHNMGNLEAVEAGTGPARPMMEEISLEDFHGLVRVLLVATEAVDLESNLPDRLDAIYAEGRHLLT